MNSFRNIQKKINLVGAAISYPHRNLLWIDVFMMGMNHTQAQEFQVALDAKAYFGWTIESYMFGIKCVSVKQAMLNYNQALKNLERSEQM